MKKWDKDIINFSRRTRRGAVFLVGIFLLFTVVSYTLEVLFFKNNYQITYIDDIGEELLEKDSTVKKPSFVKRFDKKQTYQKRHPKDRFKIPADEFNPNALVKNEWMDIGLTEKQAIALLNFRDRIRGFKTKKDFKNAFVISNDLFESLESLILLPDSVVVKDSPKRSKTKKTSQKVTTIQSPFELNSADVSQLVQVHGIGEYRAKKIIEFRTQLGGFIDEEQLTLMSFLPDEVIDSLVQHISINQDIIKKIQLNSVDISELKSHPLLSNEEAYSIISLRNELGAFSKIQEVIKSPLIDIRKYRKIKPYLDL